MITIYFDIDGVLANYISAYRKAFKEKVSASTYSHDKNLFLEFVKKEGFRTLTKLDHADALVSAVSKMAEESNSKIEILGSLGNIHYDYISEIVSQKKEWVKSSFNVNWHMNFVLHKGLKKRFATPNALLIDDTLVNVEEFRSEGGLAVHYRPQNHNNDLELIRSALAALEINKLKGATVLLP